MVITSGVTWPWGLHTSLPGTGEVCSCAFWSWSLRASMIRRNSRDATECACCATALHVFEFLFIIGPHHSKNTHENTLLVSPPVRVFAGYMIENPCPIHRDGSASLHSDSEVCFSFVTPPSTDVVVSKSFRQHPVCTRTVATHTAVHTGPPAGQMVITSGVTWPWGLHTSLPGTGEVCSCAFWSWSLRASMIRRNSRDATECACCATALHVFEFLFIIGPHHSKNTHENTLLVSPPVQVFAGYMIENPCPIHRDGSASLHSDSEVCFSFVTAPSTDVIVSMSFRQHPVCTRTVTTHNAVHTGPPAGLMVITSCVTWSWGLHTSLPGTGEVCSPPPPVVPLAVPASSTSAPPCVTYSPLTCDSEDDRKVCCPILGAKCGHATSIVCGTLLRASTPSRLPPPSGKHAFYTYLFRPIENPLGRSNADPLTPCRINPTLLSVTGGVCSSPYHNQIQDSRAPPYPIPRL